eukprot:1553469-Pyramimonas_sp.AAC.1
MCRRFSIPATTDLSMGRLVRDGTPKSRTVDGAHVAAAEDGRAEGPPAQDRAAPGRPPGPPPAPDLLPHPQPQLPRPQCRRGGGQAGVVPEHPEGAPESGQPPLPAAQP